MTAKKKSIAINKNKVKSKPDLDLHSELIEAFVEKGKKAGVVSYEEILEFCEQSHLSETETNELLRTLERENIELLMQEELEGESEVESFEKEEERAATRAKNFENNFDYTDEEESGEEAEDEVEKEEVKETESAYITDAVKCYLRDIGKIPLLNKKTETVIADQIAGAKKDSIEAISKFPFIHKEIVSLIEKIERNTLPLKEIIQFSEFDEENLPRYEEEKKSLLLILRSVKSLIDNESKIYQSYRNKLEDDGQKKKMLEEVRQNREAISKIIQTIKLANKFIRKLGKRIEKSIQKIKEKQEVTRQNEMLFKQYSHKKNLTDFEKQELEEFEKNIRSSNKSVKKIEQEMGLKQQEVNKYYKQLIISQTKDKRAKDDLARANSASCS